MVPYVLPRILCLRPPCLLRSDSMSCEETCLDLRWTGSSLATGQCLHLSRVIQGANNHEAHTVQTRD